MSYFQFNKWFYNQLNSDWKYMNINSLYSFIFTYPVPIFNRDNIPHIKPKYPWSEHINDGLVKAINSEISYIEIIRLQKKKIEDLMIEIEKLKGK
jgi:hypothetical protein